MKASGLDEIFDIEPIKEEQDSDKIINFDSNRNNIVPILDSSKNSEEENEGLNDSKFIRDNLKTLADKLDLALENALTAQQEETIARNSEAISSLADGLNKTLSNLMQLCKLEKEQKSTKNENGGSVTNNNQILIATTEDVINRITKQIKNNDMEN